MRKHLSLGVAAALLALLGLAPVAQAHHVANQQATCDLVNNVPTITASVDFVEFGSPDTDVHIVVGVDNTVPVDVRLPSAPAVNPWRSPGITTTAGDHQVYIYVTWKHYRTPYDSSFGPTTVTCPPPVQPPVVLGCNGQPIPPGTTPPVCVTPPVVLGCNGQPVPPGLPAPTCVTPPPTPPTPTACVLTRVHRTAVHVGMRNVIRVHTNAGTVVRLHLPKTKTIKRTAPASGFVKFVVRPKHSGRASVTGAECGKVTLRVHKRHRTTIRRVPRLTG